MPPSKRAVQSTVVLRVDKKKLDAELYTSHVFEEPEIDVPPTVAVHRGQRCWWCHGPCAAGAVQCPVTPDSSEGLFCDYRCALAYAKHKTLTGGVVYDQCVSLLYLAGCPQRTVAAPPHILLAEYGGSLTREQYRTCSSEFMPTDNRYYKGGSSSVLFVEKKIM